MYFLQHGTSHDDAIQADGNSSIASVVKLSKGKALRVDIHILNLENSCGKVGWGA